MPSFAAHSAVALVAEPHQMRSRSPSEYGSTRSSPAGWETSAGDLAREAFAVQHLEECFGLPPRHGGIVRPLGRREAEIAVAVDHLLRRAARDAELQPPAGDEVGRAGVLRHVERVLVAHVDDGGPELDPLGPRPARRQQRKRRAELPGEMMHAEIRPSAPSCSAATASSIDCSSASAAVRVADCGDGVQCPKERKPMCFMGRRRSCGFRPC